jgi:tetratricopeptide (TPR) repeat protein
VQFQKNGSASKWILHSTITVMVLFFLPRLWAAPFVPNNDEQVLERLPLSVNSAGLELRALRTALNASPLQLDLAVRLAQRYVALGKYEADPRYYGYAQGVLTPWWSAPEPPPEVLLLRALILQNRHDFDGALQDLAKLLKRQPNNAQAWLAQAIILQVRARYEEAQRSCLPLLELESALAASTCLGNIGSLTGHALKSYEFLRDALQQAQEVSTDQRLWSLTVLAEIAAGMGRNNEADQYFNDALKVRSQDVYLLGAYADFLLDQKRALEVVALLADKIRIDSLLLRVALAKQQLGADDLPDMITSLKARFDASRLRGENLHQGDEARFALFLRRQPQKALQLAQANWTSQREPKDARILLESAIAAGNPAAAQPVIELLNSTGMEHVQLRRLLRSLR